MNGWGLKEGVAQISGSVEVLGGFLLCFPGEDSGGVRCCVVDVEVAGDQIGEAKNSKGRLRGDRVGG